MSLLAGDIGGTKTRLALFEWRPDGLETLAEAAYPSADYGDLDGIVGGFLAQQPGRPQAAAFGLAGPVEGRVW